MEREKQSSSLVAIVALLVLIGALAVIGVRWFDLGRALASIGGALVNGTKVGVHELSRPAKAFWVLGCLPGLLSLYYYFFIARRTFSSRRKSVEEYLAFRRSYDSYHGRQSVLAASDADQLEQPKPRFFEFLIGAAALTLPFLLVAWLSNHTPTTAMTSSAKQTTPGEAGNATAASTETSAAKSHSASTPSATRAAPKAKANAPADADPQPRKGGPPARQAPGAPRKATPSEPRSEEQGAGPQKAGMGPEEAIKGLVLAGYGAFFYLLVLLIYRVNATALSPKFLVTSTLRVSIALVLGFLAGLAGLFDVVSSETQRSLLFVLVGAFPSYAGASLQRKAREWFKRPIPGTEPLPLELIDGIDDLIAERLGEMGISEIQHLSTTDPGDLSLRTLYPLERVIDWIDQAILITYLQEHIVEARQLAIRGAIDMKGTYYAYLKATTGSRPSVKQGGESRRPAGAKQVTPHQGEAQEATSPAGAAGPSAGADDTKVLLDLATKSGLPIHVINSIGDSLVNDYQVRFLSDLWQRRGAPLGVGEAANQVVAEVLKSPYDGRTFGESLVDAGSAAQLLNKGLEGALRQALDERLQRISLRWLGQLDDLKGRIGREEIEREILRKIVYHANEESTPSRKNTSPATCPFQA